MDAIRSFASGNRSTIVNVIYVIAFLTVLYYLYKFWVEGNSLDLDLLNIKTSAKTPMPLEITQRDPSGRLKNPDLRVKTGGEYTLCMWLYINDWSYKSGLPKGVFQIADTGVDSNSLMVGILYPNEPKMMIRTYTGATASGITDFTANADFKQLLEGKSNAAANMFSPSVDMPMCDVQDIDLQRWIHVAISVNGRIVDVYMDGKLARSCILPEVPKASERGNQVVVMCPNGGFGGFISGVQFYGYAVTPDRIYSTYQAGPYSSANFLTYIGEKLGIKMTYSGAGGQQKAFQRSVAY
jgi:hypothetical protein